MAEHPTGHDCPACRAREAILALFPTMMTDGENPEGWIIGCAQALGLITGMYADAGHEQAQRIAVEEVFRDGVTSGIRARARVDVREATIQ